MQQVLGCQRRPHRGRGRPRDRDPSRGRCRGFVRDVGGDRLGRGTRARTARGKVHTAPIREDGDRGLADTDAGEWGYTFVGAYARVIFVYVA